MGKVKGIITEVIELYEEGLSEDLISNGLNMDYAEVRAIVREYTEYNDNFDFAEYSEE